MPGRKGLFWIDFPPAVLNFFCFYTDKAYASPRTFSFKKKGKAVAEGCLKGQPFFKKVPAFFPSKKQNPVFTGLSGGFLPRKNLWKKNGQPPPVILTAPPFRRIQAFWGGDVFGACIFFKDLSLGFRISF